MDGRLCTSKSKIAGGIKESFWGQASVYAERIGRPAVSKPKFWNNRC
jgi:hypothetical protein